MSERKDHLIDNDDEKKKKEELESIRSTAADIVFSQEAIDDPEFDRSKVDEASEEASAFLFDDDDDADVSDFEYTVSDSISEDEIENEKFQKLTKKKSKKSLFDRSSRKKSSSRSSKDSSSLKDEKRLKILQSRGFQVLLLVFFVLMVLSFMNQRFSFLDFDQKEKPKPIKVTLMSSAKNQEVPKTKKSTTTATKKEENESSNLRKENEFQDFSEAMAASDSSKPKVVKTERNEAEIKNVLEEVKSTSKTLKEAIESLDQSVVEISHAVSSLKEKVHSIEERLNRLERIESGLSELKSTTNDLGVRLTKLEQRLDLESKKLNELYKKLSQKRKRMKIVDSYTVVIDNVVYHVGSILNVKGQKFVIVKIDPSKGVYLKDSKGNTWLLKRNT